MIKIIQPSDMPAPETLVAYDDGKVGAAMFHYAAEGQSFEDIAWEHGFNCKCLSLEQDDDADPALTQAYEDGAADVCERWNPATPDGWLLAAKHDTEDGPVALFIRKREVTAP